MESVREAINGLKQLSAPQTPASSCKDAAAGAVNGGPHILRRDSDRPCTLRSSFQSYASPLLEEVK